MRSSQSLTPVLQANVVLYSKLISSLTAVDWKAALQSWENLLLAGLQMLGFRSTLQLLVPAVLHF